MEQEDLDEDDEEVDEEVDEDERVPEVMMKKNMEMMKMTTRKAALPWWTP